MNLQSLCFNHLKQEGLTPEIIPNLGIVFKYQRRTFIVINDLRDDRYFKLLLPNIQEVDTGNKIKCLISANIINMERKIVKVIVRDDNVDAVVEMLIDSTPVVSDFIPRSLDILLQAQEGFYHYFKQQ